MKNTTSGTSLVPAGEPSITLLANNNGASQLVFPADAYVSMKAPNTPELVGPLIKVVSSIVVHTCGVMETVVVLKNIIHDRTVTVLRLVSLRLWNKPRSPARTSGALAPMLPLWSTITSTSSGPAEHLATKLNGAFVHVGVRGASLQAGAGAHGTAPTTPVTVAVSHTVGAAALQIRYTTV